jgi:hypothetical protein
VTEDDPTLWHTLPDDPDGPTVNVDGVLPALTHAMGAITDRLAVYAAAVQPAASPDDLRDWLGTPPEQWPATPELAVWVALDHIDPQLRYELPEGVLLNILDDALNVLLGMGVLSIPPG